MKLHLNDDYTLKYGGEYDVELIRPNQSMLVKKPLLTDSTTLNVLVWNIFKQKRKTCISLLEKYIDSAQLILLQEAQNTPQLINFLTKHNKIAYQVPAYSFNDIYAGVMTVANNNPFYALPFKEQEPLIRIPKSALVTAYLLNESGHSLLVANIHAINFSFGVKKYQQQLNILLKQIQMHQGPVILAGDFNSWSQRRLNILYHLIHSIELLPVNFSSDIRKTFMGRPLDFVFYRGLRLKQADIIHTEASDHNPLLVSFDLL